MPAIQLILTISGDGTLSAEAPGKNGARHKLSLVSPSRITIDSIAEALQSNRFVLAEELNTQFHEERGREIAERLRVKKLARETQQRNIEYIAANHPRQLATAYPGIKIHHTKSSAFFVVPKEDRLAAVTRAPEPTARAGKLALQVSKIVL